MFLRNKLTQSSLLAEADHEQFYILIHLRKAKVLNKWEYSWIVLYSVQQNYAFRTRDIEKIKYKHPYF